MRIIYYLCVFSYEIYDIYSTTLIKLPTPRFVVFYNGLKNMPEQSVLRISDAFIDRNKKGCLEVEVTMLNINIGKNKELMESCKYLKEYAIFVGKVREYNNEGLQIKAAIDKAVEYCIKHDVLKEVLLQHKAEVAQLIFREFDEEEYRRYNERKFEKMEEQLKQQLEKQLKEQLKEQAHHYEEQLKVETKQAKAESEQVKAENERLRRILAEHGLSE